VTFAAVGSTFQEQGSSSVSLSPAGIGHLILMEVITLGGSAVPSSVSGGGATWTQLRSVAGSVNSGDGAAVFAGQVTATGSHAATLTFSGTPSDIAVTGREFSSTVGSWALDTSGTLDLGSGTVDFPSLAPAGSGELYFGFMGGNAVTGSTSGYTYFLDADSWGMCFNAACGSGAQQPVWGTGSGSVFGIAVLMKETAAAPAATPRPARAVQAVKRAAYY
jgi:hypothetical protein